MHGKEKIHARIHSFCGRSTREQMKVYVVARKDEFCLLEIQFSSLRILSGFKKQKISNARERNNFVRMMACHLSGFSDLNTNYKIM